MPWRTVECLSKRELEMNYHRSWTHDRSFGGGSRALLWVGCCQEDGAIL